MQKRQGVVGGGRRRKRERERRSLWMDGQKGSLFRSGLDAFACRETPGEGGRQHPKGTRLSDATQIALLSSLFCSYALPPVPTTRRTTTDTTTDRGFCKACIWAVTLLLCPGPQLCYLTPCTRLSLGRPVVLLCTAGNRGKARRRGPFTESRSIVPYDARNHMQTGSKTLVQ